MQPIKEFEDLFNMLVLVYRQQSEKMGSRANHRAIHYLNDCGDNLCHRIYTTK